MTRTREKEKENSEKWDPKLCGPCHHANQVGYATYISYLRAGTVKPVLKGHCYERAHALYEQFLGISYSIRVLILNYCIGMSKFPENEFTLQK